MYVCPVGCRRLRPKRGDNNDDEDEEGVHSVVAYYRVLAKEQVAGRRVMHHPVNTPFQCILSTRLVNAS